MAHKIEFIKPGLGTGALLDNISEGLSKKVPIEVEEVTDIKKTQALKENFLKEARNAVKENP